ncbi:MAG: oligonucleotide/oligosaccharide-binding fold domain-containing protein [Nocardioides sp.]
MCKREFLNYLRVRGGRTGRSCARSAADMGVALGACERRGGSGARERGRDPSSLLAGLLSSARWRSASPEPGQGRKPRGPREYLGARGQEFAIFPGSALRGKNPPFLMAGELVETSRLWARQNAAIAREWAERLGAHLVSAAAPSTGRKSAPQCSPTSG